MEERNDKTWCEALHTYSNYDIGVAMDNAITKLTGATTFGFCDPEEWTYTKADLGDAILAVCDRGYEYPIFDPYERIKELERENEMLKNMLKECEI